MRRLLLAAVDRVSLDNERWCRWPSPNRMFSGLDGGGFHRPCLRHAVENVAKVSPRIVPFAMLTEQQLAVLRSEPGSNRVAKAMALSGVTQVIVAKALGLTQPYLRQRCRPWALPDGHRGECQEVRFLLRLPYRGSVPVTPRNA